MSHRGLSIKHALPANPTWLEFVNSDGDQSLWPTNNSEVVDAEGHVNFMRIAGIDEPISIKWRCEAAKGVAKLSNLDRECECYASRRMTINLPYSRSSICPQNMAERLSDV